MKHVLKIFTVLALSLCLILFASAETVASGTCGSNVTWTLDSEGTMTLSGSGDTTDYFSYETSHRPWDDYKSKIKKIVIENRVATITRDLFLGLGNLEEVYISPSVSLIGQDAFGYCAKIKAFYVDEKNAFYSSEDGVLFDADKTVLIQYPAANPRTEYTMPNTVTKLETMAFYKAKKLVNITFSSSLKQTSYRAFSGCSSIKEVVLPEGLEKLSLGSFEYCSLLEKIVFPSTIKTIAGGSFAYCTSLKEFTFPQITDIYNGMFEGCTALKKVVLPEGITEIGSYMFYKCAALTEVYIPDTVKLIDEYAFAGCRKLDVKIPSSLTKIENGAFLNCKSLKSISVPSGVTRISQSAFSGCSSLVEVTLPDNVTVIEDYAFKNCTSLRRFVSLATYGVPTTSQMDLDIQDKAFEGCSSLVTVYLDAYNPRFYSYTVFNGCEALADIYIRGEKDDVSYRSLKYLETQKGVRIHFNHESMPTFTPDYNGSGKVDTVDVLLCLKESLNAPGSLSIDIDGDGKTTLLDIMHQIKLATI
ncbi:MAG: hypothetical protein E7598_00965 [Ruminococcaceae bacterium]|nr:hypothetical protein [Oscillospiraceae bacterium]